MADNNSGYRVLFRGKIAQKFTRKQVATTLGKMLKASPAQLTPIFEGQQKISFNNRPLDFRSAVKLKVKLLRLGLITEIEPWDRSANNESKKAQPAKAEPAPPTSSECPAETVETPTLQSSGEQKEHVAAASPKKEPAPEPGPHETTIEKPAASEPSASAKEEAPKEETPSEEAPTEATREEKRESAAKPKETQQILVERLEDLPDPSRIIDVTPEPVGKESEFEDATSETVFIEDHPFNQPWWRRLLSWPVVVAILVTLGLVGKWIYEQTRFTPSPAAMVVENHLATDKLSLMGLVDFEKLTESNQWMEIDTGALDVPYDLALIKSMGIEPGRDLSDLVISQHAHESSFPTTFVLIGQFDENELRKRLQTIFGATTGKSKDRLFFESRNENGCQRQFAIHLNPKELILAPASFIAEAYELIHERFDGKPAMLKAWRIYREYHPVSLAVFNTEDLADETIDLLEALLADIDIDDFETVYMGLDISHILTGNAVINANLRGPSQQALDEIVEALSADSPLGKVGKVVATTGEVSIDIPIATQQVDLSLLHQHSLLGLCPDDPLVNKAP